LLREARGDGCSASSRPQGKVRVYHFLEARLGLPVRGRVFPVSFLQRWGGSNSNMASLLFILTFLPIGIYKGNGVPIFFIYFLLRFGVEVS
jgi:hypothetical protein